MCSFLLGVWWVFFLLYRQWRGSLCIAFVRWVGGSSLFVLAVERLSLCCSCDGLGVGGLL